MSDDSAFPRDPEWFKGLTKRELFAAMAMQVIGVPKTSLEEIRERFDGSVDRARQSKLEGAAKHAVAMADALIAALAPTNSERNGGADR